uniref:Dentin sialophosphoprotein-like n=1 Tax=Arundo donax TaxID=35708 RepID=A0A0A9G312_ARUDO
MESPNNINGDSDDWQAFASSSGQGGGLLTPVGETSSISPEHPSEAISVDLWPVGNADKHSTAPMVNETNDTFDDWQDFATSGQVQNASFSQAGDTMEVSTVSHNEIDVESWFMGNSRETVANGINVISNNWQGFTGSDQSQQNSSNVGGGMMNISFEQHKATDPMQSWVNDSNKEARNTSSTNIESDAFDIWQDFAKSGHQQANLSNAEKEGTSVPPEPAKEIDAMDLWLTSNVKESNNNEVVGRIDGPSDGWQDFASFGQAQRSTKIPGEGHLVKDPPGTEILDLRASSHAEEKNIEQINENNDPFDDWQDFKNSGETSLQVFSDASLLDRPSASRLDAPVEKTVPFDGNFKSNGMQQAGDVDSLSGIWPTKGLDSDATSKPEPANANVETLLSQMHDLSFMLKDELSVPGKPADHSKS